jgi:anti-sigma B factor antagonist
MQFEMRGLEDGINQVKLVGRLDLKGVNAIDNQFTSAVSCDKAPVLVDMTEVDFLASTGIRLLLSNAIALANRGSKLVLFNPTPLVREALVNAGFADLIPMYNDFGLACETLKAVIVD